MLYEIKLILKFKILLKTLMFINLFLKTKNLFQILIAKILKLNLNCNFNKNNNLFGILYSKII